jgi:hypothetical protein
MALELHHGGAPPAWPPSPILSALRPPEREGPARPATASPMRRTAAMPSTRRRTGRPLPLLHATVPGRKRCGFSTPSAPAGAASPKLGRATRRDSGAAWLAGAGPEPHPAPPPRLQSMQMVGGEYGVGGWGDWGGREK